MNCFNKFLSVVFSSVLLLGFSTVWAADNYPDQTTDANAPRTPYGISRVNLVGTGQPDAISIISGSGLVYNYFYPTYFKTNVSPEDLAHNHFDFSAFRTTHPNLGGPPYASGTAGVPYSNKSFSFVGVRAAYFVDTMAGYSNALGVIPVANYPALGQHPLTNVPPNSLIFPLTRDAVKFSPAMGGSGLARYELDSGDVLAHPLLLSDQVNIPLALRSQVLDFFLIPDVANSSVDSLTPTQANRVWDSEIARNWENGQIGEGNFQHFQFYHVPELDLLFPGLTNYLVAVEDLSAAQGADKDFNDLFFLIQCQVPEPGTYLLIGTLLSIAFFIARRRTVEA
jgi:hypothetical protein